MAERLGGPAGLRGVMMIPVRWHGRLLATVELARMDHEFRGSDVGLAEEIARGVGQRVQKMFDSRSR